MQAHKKSIPDLTIIGAGLVGTSLALALLQAGLSLQILEHHIPETVSNTRPPDTRPITLSYGSHQILKTLGLWSALAPHATPVHTVHVSHEKSLGRLQFEAADYQLPALGYVIPFHQLQKILYQRLMQKARVSYIPIQTIEAITNEQDSLALGISTANGRERFSTPLLIASDGSQSTVRRLLNIPVRIYPMDQVAIALRLNLETPHQCIAYERFTDQGTLALLPGHPSHHYQAIWSMSQNDANTIKTESDTHLIESIRLSIGNRLPPIVGLQRGHSYPLHMKIAKKSIVPHAVLLGNAAHTLYPIAAQGFNLGLRNAAILAEILVTAAQKKQNLGDIHVLQAYQDWHQPHQNSIIGMTQAATTLFHRSWPGSRTLRGLGLLATDLCTPLKRRLAKSMLGLSGRVPKLALGVPFYGDQ